MAQNRSFRTFSLAIVAFAMILAGCQSYEPLPLDLQEHQAQWNARGVTDPDLIEFANKLAQRDNAAATGYDPSDGISLPEAETIALFFNADLRTLRLETGVTLAGALEAGRWKDPELNVSGELILASIANPWLAAASISFTIPLSGRLGVEQDKAMAEHRAKWAEVVAAEWQTIGGLRELWLQLAAVELNLDVTRQQREETQGILDTARGLMETGSVSPSELRVFEIELLRLRLDEVELKRDAEVLRLQVRDVLGLTPDAPVTLHPQLGLSRKVPELHLAEALKRNAQLSARATSYEVAEQSLRLEIRKQYPDLVIGPSYSIEEGQSRIGIGFGLPLPIINLNRRGIAEARAARLAAKSSYEAEYEHLVGHIAQAERELASATSARELIENELLPAAARQLTEVKELARLSQFDAILLLESLRARFGAMKDLVTAQRNEETARAHLLNLIGPTYAPLPAPTESSDK